MKLSPQLLYHLTKRLNYQTLHSLRRVQLAGLVAIALLIAACGGSRKKAPLTRATGKPGQILVVAPYSIEETPAAQALITVFEHEYPFLPQAEKSFSLTFIGHKEFTHMLKTFRNIIILAPDAPDSILNPQEPVRMSIAQDQWAAPQHVIYLQAKENAQILNWITTNAQILYPIFANIEQQRLLNDYSRVYNKELQKQWIDKFGVRLFVPPSILSRVEAEGFAWASLETKDISQGLILYSTPLHGPESWSTDSILAQRDALTQIHIPGPNQGTYMTTGHVIPPKGQWVKRGQDSLYYIRGFWEVHGHPMGGPFVSYSSLNTTGDSIITTCGYVYAPRFKKRDYVRELEAMLQSQSLIPQSSNTP